MGSRVWQTVKTFRGMRQYLSKTNLTPEYAEDCLNVIVNKSGALTKFRSPTAYTGAFADIGAGRINPIFNFQQAVGVRQILGFVGARIVRWDNALTPLTVDNTPTNANGIWDVVESNNLAFMANGTRMLKWNGAAIQGWGGLAPLAAPSINISGVIVTLQRAGNVVSAVFAAPVDLSAGNDVVAISLAGSATFNGEFLVTVKTDQTHYQWVQTAANEGPVAGGQWLAVAQNPFYVAAANQVVRANGIVTATVTVSSGQTPALGPDFLASSRVLQIVASGMVDGTFNGVFTVISKQGNVLTWAQPQTADATTNGNIASNLQPVLAGMQYAYAYKNSVDGTETSASARTVQLGGAAGRALLLTLTAVAPADVQFDTIVWFRTLDSGGDLFLHHEANIATEGLVLFDTWNDALLDPSQRAQLINNPPPIGKYLAKFGGRIFVFNLVGGKQDIAYSGYERVRRGRPEQAYPPYNKLRLAIGADEIKGGGVIQAGVVAFSKSNEMFMFKGLVEDIVTDTPVLFTAFLDQLPWQEGLLSHYTCQSTPYGLIYLAADHCVKVFDGGNEPNDISSGVYPILRRITQGYEEQCRATFFNYLERDWYVIILPVDGSARPNVILFFDLKSQDNFGVFAAQVGQIDTIAVIEDQTSLRRLIISQAGRLYDLQVRDRTQGGVYDVATELPPTSTILPGYWQNGYYGNDTPQLGKMFRFGRLVTDPSSANGSSGASGFNVNVRLMDDEGYTFQQPLTVTPRLVKSGKFGINKRAKRAGVTVNFPSADIDASLLELQMAMIPTGEQ